MTEKKDELTECMRWLEVIYWESVNTDGLSGSKAKRYKQVIDYLKELQEARKTFRKTQERIFSLLLPVAMTGSL